MDRQRRPCKNKDCDKPATHAIAWNGGWAYYCENDAEMVVQVDNMMGFGLPRSSMRPMTDAEMFLQSKEIN